jgi:hypothetical protein
MNPFTVTPPPDGEQPTVEVARRREQWRAAAQSLFPTLVADPDSYARAVETIGVLAAELGRRRAGLEDLARVMADPEDFAAQAGQAPPGPVPLSLLVGVACGMRERELIAEQVRCGHRAAIERARAIGSEWAVLNGPECIEDLTGGTTGVGSCTHLHIPSGTELRATLDAWSPEPYRVDVIGPAGVSPDGGSFTRREPWIERFRRCRAEIGGGS